jgi:ankyrin repeat protein
MGRATKPIGSDEMRIAMLEARALWKARRQDEAIERATRVFQREGRDVFADFDQPMLAAMLARLDPPDGHRTWDEYFAWDAARHARRTRLPTDAEVLAQSQQDRARTPLLDAVESGLVPLVDRLLAGGADPNAVYRNGEVRWTPLAAAVHGDRLELVKKLLAAGARVEGDGITPPILSVKSVAVAEVLLAAGASLAVKDDQGRTPLFRVVDTAGSIPLIEFLAARGSPLTGAGKRTLLDAAPTAAHAAALRPIIRGR